MRGEGIVKEIRIKNFRSLKDTGMQTLSPITILVGENSSGKSTFLRAFPLLKQSISRRTSGPILWAGDVDDYVDFGSFEETVTNDKSKEISFRFKFNVNSLGQSKRYNWFDEIGDTSDSEIDYEITIAEENGREFVSKFSLTVNSAQIEFDLINNSLYLVNQLMRTHIPTDNEEDAKGQNTRGRYRQIRAYSRSFGFSLPTINELWDELNERLSIAEKEEFVSIILGDIIMDLGARLSKNQKLIQFEENSLNDAEMSTYFLKKYNAIVDIIEKSSNVHISDLIITCYIYKVFSEIDDYIYAYFKQVHYIAPLRATAERYYRLRNLAVDEVDYQGKNLAIFINTLSKSRVKEFQDWTMTNFGFMVSTDKSKGHLSLLIRLEKSDKAINLSDTGFGYSQVLPIITQLWELSTQKRNKISGYYGENQNIPLVVAIEQPELHLHPAVQARLAKAFIACVKLAKENGYELQLLLETHSETIVNYMGRAIAKGQINKDDVSVILFEKQDSNNPTEIRNSNYDEHGYLCNWPYGFFDSEE